VASSVAGGRVFPVRSATANAVEGLKTQRPQPSLRLQQTGQAQMERLLRNAIRFPIADVVVYWLVRKAPQ